MKALAKVLSVRLNCYVTDYLFIYPIVFKSQGIGCAPAFVFRQEMQIPYPRIMNWTGLRQRALYHNICLLLINVYLNFPPECFW